MKKGDLLMNKKMKYVKPATLKADIAACMITPFKSRVATLCVNPVLMGVQFQSFNCATKDISLILNKNTSLKKKELNKLVNNFINYKIKNELNTIDIKLSNKIINNVLQNIINDDMKILTSIEAVNINKLVYSNETINYLNEKYYIVSYSILKSLKIVKSDFLILENIDNDNINNIIHTISREIDWVNT